MQGALGAAAYSASCHLSLAHGHAERRGTLDGGDHRRGGQRRCTVDNALRTRSLNFVVDSIVLICLCGRRRTLDGGDH